MILLDGRVYFVHQTKYANKPIKLADTQRGLTGLPLRVESGKFQIEYDLTLLCTTGDVTALRASFNKVLASNDALDFMDEEGVLWTAAAGSNDATHRYNTGVYFDPMQDPKPMTARGWVDANRMLVSIHLLTKAFTYVLAETGFLLTEAGEPILTEAGEHLLWQIGF